MATISGLRAGGIYKLLGRDPLSDGILFLEKPTDRVVRERGDALEPTPYSYIGVQRDRNCVASDSGSYQLEPV